MRRCIRNRDAAGLPGVHRIDRGGDRRAPCAELPELFKKGTEMTAARQKQFKLIAFLLQYPDEALMDSLADVSEAAADIDDPQTRQTVLRFRAYLENTPLMDLQEQYTAAFDLAPATCLNLTYHLVGDDAERGRVLSALQQVYARAGYGAAAPELPDYLPMVLEFLAIWPDAPNAERLWSCLSAVHTLAQRLMAAGSPYAPLFDCLAALTPHAGGRGRPGINPQDDADS